MTYFDIAIIYLSLGAPLGVYSLLQMNGSGIRLTGAIRALGSMIFWPAYGTMLLYPGLQAMIATAIASKDFAQLRKADSEIVTSTQNTLASLKDSLTVFPRAKAGSHYSVVERYAELGLMLQHPEPQDNLKFSDLLAAAGHPNPRIGAKCLERRNQQTVLNHHKVARAEVEELVDGLSVDQKTVRKIILDLGEIADPHNNPLTVRLSVCKGEEWKTIEVRS